ncbi:hypothetical protein [Psittacicella hinzii]|nr:hypothetical protein [Psittacicella hinzii]
MSQVTQAQSALTAASAQHLDQKVAELEQVVKALDPVSEHTAALSQAEAQNFLVQVAPEVLKSEQANLTMSLTAVFTSLAATPTVKVETIAHESSAPSSSSSNQRAVQLAAHKNVSASSQSTTQSTNAKAKPAASSSTKVAHDPLAQKIILAYQQEKRFFDDYQAQVSTFLTALQNRAQKHSFLSYQQDIRYLITPIANAVNQDMQLVTNERGEQAIQSNNLDHIAQLSLLCNSYYNLASHNDASVDQICTMRMLPVLLLNLKDANEFSYLILDFIKQIRENNTDEGVLATDPLYIFINASLNDYRKSKITIIDLDRKLQVIHGNSFTLANARPLTLEQVITFSADKFNWLVTKD